MKPSSPFHGEAPGFAADKLVNGGAQMAHECKLVNGNLAAWKSLGNPQLLPKQGTIAGLFPLDPQGAAGGPFWLHWTTPVNVAKSLIAGDTDERIYFTGSGPPSVTSRSLATDAPVVGIAGQYPYRSLTLGVPAPVDPPQFEVISNALITPGAMPILNGGAELGNMSHWRTTSGSPGVYTNGDIAGFFASAGETCFHGGTADITEAYQEIAFSKGPLKPAVIDITWKSAPGLTGSVSGVGLQFFDKSGGPIGAKIIKMASVTTARQWVNGSLTGTAIPAAATSVRIFQRYVKAPGVANDAYLDTIIPAITYSRFTSDGVSLDGWSTALGAATSIHPDSSVGWGAPSIDIQSDSGNIAAIYVDVVGNTANSVSLTFDAYQYYKNGSWGVLEIVLLADEKGVGQGLRFDTIASLINTSAWTSPASAVSTVTNANQIDVAFTCNLQITKVSGNIYTVTGTSVRKDTGAVIAVFPSFQINAAGGFIGFRGWATSGDSRKVNIDNVAITVSASVASDTVVEDEVATAYSYTLVNSLGDESAPSPPTETIIKSSATFVKIITPTTAPAGNYGITKKRLYRLASGSNSTEFLLVKEMPFSTASYLDERADSVLGEVMEPTEDWVIPPADAHSIVALANGITAMASKNQLLLSPIGRPHTYPTEFRLSTDYPIVALGVIDADIVVLTQAGIYIASGTDPARYSMAKIEYPQGCVSKRSVASMAGFGVVYASPDGLVAIGRGAPDVITKHVWSQAAWRSINPSSLIGIVHDGRYYGFWKVDDANKGGFVFDPRQPEKGITRLSLCADAVYQDPSSDKLYVVTGASLMQWEGGSSGLRYTYREKVNMATYPVNLSCARVRALDYDDLIFRLYYDDVLVQETAVFSEEEFVLQGNSVANRTWYRELEGSSEVRGWQISDSMSTL